MDIQTALICVGVVAISAAVVFLTSFFGIREKSYEEAIEEQRRQNNWEPIIKPRKPEKTKKEKKDKTKKLKKSKEEEKVEVKTELSFNEASTNELSSEEADTQAKSDHIKIDPQPIVVELSADDGVRERKVSNSKAPKPILINKTSEVAAAGDSTATGDVDDKTEAELEHRNSFDILHPKDELELSKIKGKKKKASIEKKLGDEVSSPEQEVQDLVVEVTEAKIVSEAGNSIIELQEQAIADEDKQPDRTVLSKKVKKTKALGSLERNTSDISANQIIDIVKNVILTNEEIQVLTDILLNKQSETTEWRKKNDPVACLKKQLQEKTQDLEAKTKNLQAVIQKTRELRQELAQEKSKQQTSKEKVVQSQQEIQLLHAKLKQTFEQHQCEMKTMQTQIQQIQTKAGEERGTTIRLQEENSRLQQHLQQVQADQHLKHELEQLRNERKQFDATLTSLQKSKEDLVRQIQQYEGLLSKKKSEEGVMQKRLSDLSQDLKQSEAKYHQLSDEFKALNNKYSTLERENLQLKKCYDDADGLKDHEINQIRNQVNELSKEKIQFEEALLQCRLNHTNGNLSSSEREKYDKLAEELQQSQLELDKQRSEVELQKQKNNELREKNWKTMEALNLAEKSKEESVNSALQEAGKKFECRLKNELISFEDEKKKAEDSLRTIQQQRDSLAQEREQLKRVITLLPGSKIGEETLVTDFESALQNLLDQLKTASTNFTSDAENEQISKLESQVRHYQTVLAETETILDNLQQKVSLEEKCWKEKFHEVELNLLNVTKENERLLVEKDELQTGLTQVQGLRESVTEMELKLKELQSKLQGEENEKRLLEAKYDEEKHEIDRLKADCMELKTQIEQEKKTAKDLHSQNVRLNSLVKIGQDALRASEVKVKELEEQINLSKQNGSANGQPSNTGDSNKSPSCGESNEVASARK